MPLALSLSLHCSMFDISFVCQRNENIRRVAFAEWFVHVELCNCTLSSTSRVNLIAAHAVCFSFNQWHYCIRLQLLIWVNICHSCRLFEREPFDRRTLAKCKQAQHFWNGNWIKCQKYHFIMIRHCLREADKTVNRIKFPSASLSSSSDVNSERERETDFPANSVV